MKDFLEAVVTNKPVAYGEAAVEKVLERGTVRMLLLSEELDTHEIERLVQKAECLGADEVLSSTSEPGCQL